MRVSLLNKIILFFAFLISISPLYSQSLQIMYSEENVSGLITDLENNWIKTHALFRNISSEPKEIIVRATVIERAQTHQIGFCWTVCQIIPETQSYVQDGPKILQAGETSGEAFYGYIAAAELAGTTKVKFEFFVADNPSDKVEYTATMTVNSLGTDDDFLSLKPTTLSPNPASDNAVISYNLSGADNVVLNLYNPAGVSAGSYQLDTENNIFTLNTSDLPQGSYYYSISINGIVKETKSFIVLH